MALLRLNQKEEVKKVLNDILGDIKLGDIKLGDIKLGDIKLKKKEKLIKNKYSNLVIIFANVFYIFKYILYFYNCNWFNIFSLNLLTNSSGI